MPAKPSYCRNLPEAIDFLRRHPSELVGRKDLEDLLGVSKTVAWRLLRQCGVMPGPGNTLVCRREVLLLKLERLLTDGGKVDFEVKRRERLSTYLEQIRPEVIATRTKVVPDSRALAMISSRFTSLPGNVVLKAGSLHIDFHGTAEFLAAIGSVVYALNNDFEAISQFLDPPSPTSAPHS